MKGIIRNNMLNFLPPQFFSCAFHLCCISASSASSQLLNYWTACELSLSYFAAKAYNSQISSVQHLNLYTHNIVPPLVFPQSHKLLQTVSPSLTLLSRPSKLVHLGHFSNSIYINQMLTSPASCPVALAIQSQCFSWLFYILYPGHRPVLKN